MQYCTACDELLNDDLESCPECECEDLAMAVRCIHCECWCSEEGVDWVGLCTSEGNDCSGDDELADEYGNGARVQLLELSKRFLR